MFKSEMELAVWNKWDIGNIYQLFPLPKRRVSRRSCFRCFFPDILPTSENTVTTTTGMFQYVDCTTWVSSGKFVLRPPTRLILCPVCYLYCFYSLYYSNVQQCLCCLLRLIKLRCYSLVYLLQTSSFSFLQDFKSYHKIPFTVNWYG